MNDRDVAPGRPSGRGGGARLIAYGVSIGAHLAVGWMLYSARVETRPLPPQVVMVTLAPPPVPIRKTEPAVTPGPAGTPDTAPADQEEASPPETPAPSKATPAVAAVIKTPAPVTRPARVVEASAPEPLPMPMPTLGAAQLVGALTAGSGQGNGVGAGSGEGGGAGGTGGGGGVCDMVRRLQNALRNDPEIQTAAARAHRLAGADGRALLVWNGDWIQEPGQDGKGLAGVRQAIAVEVGFSPRACRAETVDGLVLISLSDNPRSPRLVLGGGRWRWSDLL